MTSPNASAFLQPGLDNWVWRVPSCPICGRENGHGGGNMEADPRAFLGHRNSDCLLERTENGYILVDADPVRTAAMVSAMAHVMAVGEGEPDWESFPLTKLKRPNVVPRPFVPRVNTFDELFVGSVYGGSVEHYAWRTGHQGHALCGAFLFETEQDGYATCPRCRRAVGRRPYTNIDD